MNFGENETMLRFWMQLYNVCGSLERTDRSLEGSANAAVFYRREKKPVKN